MFVYFIPEVQANMQAYIYVITMLVTLQFSVHVAGSDTTTVAAIFTTETVSQQTDNTEHIHSDNSLITSDSKQTDENDAIAPNVAATATVAAVAMDRETQIKVEKNLLTLFGRSKRPKPIDRSKVVIPDSLKMLYTEIMGEELRESVNLPKPGLHTKSANTVRSFTHEGMYYNVSQ